jgi:TolA-binding protein
MNTRRIAILLVGMFFAFLCLPSGTLAVPSRASPQGVRSAGNDQSVAAIEAALEKHREAEEYLQRRINELEKAQRTLLEQITQETTTGNPVAVQELQARIRELEEELEGRRRPPPQSNASFNWILGGAAFFTLALCVILLLRMQRPKPFDDSWMQAEPGILERTFSPPLDLGSSAPATVTGTEPSQEHSIASVLPDWDSASPALDVQRLKSLAEEENVRNRDSTIELAELMLSFGRINSAAEALENFIENNPKEAFAPWLKLLEVYRANGQRTEFDKIARKLNKTFNVWMVDWDNFDDVLAPAHGLETMTHIVKRLRELWGTRECQAYLQYLQRDTRDETRRGFPLAAFDDVLCLNDILEQRLGPYTGPVNTFDHDLLHAAPLTETEGGKPDSSASAGENDAHSDGLQADGEDKDSNRVG